MARSRPSPPQRRDASEAAPAASEASSPPADTTRAPRGHHAERGPWSVVGPLVPSAIDRPLALAVLALGAAHIWVMRVMYDDAFITYRYAENLARGTGLVFNAGERVEGYSNFLWTLLMSLVVLAGGRPEDWGPRLSAGIALGTLALVMWAFARRGGSATLVGVLLAASSCWATWATGGLETALFTGLVTAGALLLMIAIERPRAQRSLTNSRMLLASACALGLACLTRPDGPLVAACAGAVVVGLVVTKQLPGRAALAWLGVVALFAVPHLLWRHAYYGHWVPNTYAVKPPGMTRFVFGWRYLAEAVRDLHLWLLALPILLAFPLRAPSRALSKTDFALIAAIVVPFVVYLASTGGDFMPVYRFVAPLVPLATLASAAALESAALKLARGSSPAAPVIAWLVAAAVTLAYAGLNVRESIHQQKIWNKGELVSVAWARREVDDWLRIGDLLRKIAAPTDTLATTAAGAVPYRSGLYTIDMLGLNAPDLSHYRRLPSNRPGHMILLEEQYVVDHPPQILLSHPLVHDYPSHLGVSFELRPGWHDRVYANYDLLGLTLLGKPLRFVAVALRKDASERILLAGERAQREMDLQQGVPLTH